MRPFTTTIPANPGSAPTTRSPTSSGSSRPPDLPLEHRRYASLTLSDLVRRCRVISIAESELPLSHFGADSCDVKRPLTNVAWVGVLAGVIVGCSSSTRPLPASDAPAASTCRQADFGAIEDHGAGFVADRQPSLVRAYASTGRVLNTWDWSEAEGPPTRLWPGEADSRRMAVCYFDGSFRTSDGRTYGRALIETDGHRFQLVVADERDRVDVMRPPRA